jgi:hypothetical protein
MGQVRRMTEMEQAGAAADRKRGKECSWNYRNGNPVFVSGYEVEWIQEFRSGQIGVGV